MATVEDKKRCSVVRGTCKAQLTLFGKFVEGLNLERGLSETEFNQLVERFNKIDDIFDKFGKVQSELELLADKFEDEFNERADFEARFYELKAKGRVILDKFEKSEASERASIADDTAQSSSSLKLPAISVPIFSGDFKEWLEFRDLYISMIHESGSLSRIQKYHYLRASLQGAAARVLGGLEFSADNYEVAWTTLRERYDNPRILVDLHLQALFELEAAPSESALWLRNLIDSVGKSLNALAALGQETSHWGVLIAYLVGTKLDPATERHWEDMKGNKRDVPSWEVLKEFLKDRADSLATYEHRRSNAKPGKATGAKNGRTVVKGLVGHEVKCALCGANHSLVNCQGFLSMSPNARFTKAKHLRVCWNCLKSGHVGKECRAKPCGKCSSKHHTLLHFEGSRAQEGQGPEEGTDHRTALASLNSATHVFLSTVLVEVHNTVGERVRVRALLDSGSQSNFISASLCKRLKLKQHKVEMVVGGLGQKVSEVTRGCRVEVHSLHSGYSTSLACLVLPRITGLIPSVVVSTSHLEIPGNIALADPEFNRPGPIDLLIGSELFYTLMCIGQVSLGPHNPILQKTRFGWIVSGSVMQADGNGTVCHLGADLSRFDNGVEFDLKKFWEVEENFAGNRVLSAEELQCEEHFRKTHRRSLDGRFVVSIPFKRSITELGDSRTKAFRRFLSLERKLSNNPSLRDEYSKFMGEYLRLGHMSRVTNEGEGVAYYMPHHPVIKAESCTTKLRVVFDCSMPSSTGKSLNELQMVGPVIQPDLFEILLRFRDFRFVVSADIAKMYRQVLVEPEQRALQRILWRESPSEPLEVFELNTVTYGQASASFLAVRCLNQIAADCESDLSAIIKTSFYVDDFLHSVKSIEEGIAICNRVSTALSSGGFKLRKWISNEPAILGSVRNGAEDLQVLDFTGDDRAKILGLTWCCSADILAYRIQPFDEGAKVTKRTILSSISQVFDPLGLVSPSIIIAKILIQKLWLEKLSWDESIPASLHTVWSKLRAELPCLEKARIPRHITGLNAVYHELHGFSDASDAAYGSAVYVRTIDECDNITVRLLCAKGKVSPLKTLTIPRLELCGALVMSRLMSKVKSSTRLQFAKCVCWSDSTIVLGWIKMAPSSLKTFVSTRVSEIQSLAGEHEWRHVPTKENPADVLSRGVLPSKLVDLSLWWGGPSFLHADKGHWPNILQESKDLPEVRVPKEAFAFLAIGEFIFERYSEFSRLIRITAHLLRFAYNCRSRSLKREPVRGLLTSSELNEATKVLVRAAQRHSFPDEFDCLSKGVAVNAKSRLLSLSPFLDSDGIIRVGGRLRNSTYQFDKKHPMLLSPKHRLSRMLCECEHKKLMHAGAQLVLASIRERFWIVASRNLIRATIRNCITCSRFSPRCLSPIMGDLPQSRLISGSVFSVVGVDYMGPLNVRDKRGRGARLSKCYVSVFVCFSTKALHLELVSDLTSESFLLAFRRFVARRGRPSHVYSDNGTNFVGANRELSELGEFLSKESDKLVSSFSREGVQWHFIPAQSPHFGGLWEAGVKSVKHHLKRVAGGANLTFEHLITLLAQIEAILNSRPLSPMSQDPNDFTPLTPAHFLIGKSFLELPDPNLQHVPETRLSVFQRIQAIKQHFWRRWSKEYISELQMRTKWKDRQRDIQEGVLLLIKEDNIPPSKWRMGRVVAVHPGKDGVNRVATIRTSGGLVKRSFSKICPLPLEDCVEDTSSASRRGAC